MKKIMLTWLGGTDHDAAAGITDRGPGPIARTLEARDDLDGIHMLNNFSDRSSAAYKKWLRAKAKTKLRLTSSEIKLLTPTDFGGIYSATRQEIDAVLEKNGRDTTLVFNLSPGTYSMAACWLLLQQTRYPDAELIEASPEAGVKTVDVPFEISADYVPDLLDRISKKTAEADTAFTDAARGMPSDEAEFEDIIHRCDAMKKVIGRAQRIAPRTIPVLIEGEPGTGKHLLARAIHNASPMRAKLKRVPCGAMPEDQLEHELFGKEDGTRRVRKGALEEACGGTLFLEEVDAMPPMLQVKLLRALEDGEIVRVGGGKTVSLEDIRCISASTRQLNRCVAEGTFRGDLYYRLAGDVIILPPLRERAEDYEPLINHLLGQKKEVLRRERGLEKIGLSAGAKNAIKRYHWPGNIRELDNVLMRVATHSDQVEIPGDDIRAALRLAPVEQEAPVLSRAFTENFSLDDVLDEVTRHYIERARVQLGGSLTKGVSITKAAKILGFKNYQTLSNRIDKLGIDWP